MLRRSALPVTVPLVRVGEGWHEFTGTPPREGKLAHEEAYQRVVQATQALPLGHTLLFLCELIRLRFL